MGYSVRKQPDTITPQWGIYLDGKLIDGGFSSRWAAEDYLWKEYQSPQAS